jgi:hypothetical protein
MQFQKEVVQPRVAGLEFVECFIITIARNKSKFNK